MVSLIGRWVAASSLAIAVSWLLLPCAGVLAQEASSGNYSTMSALQQAAQAGDPTALYTLGQMHEEGRGVIQDFVQAHALYNLAAAGGHAEAQAARDRLAAGMTADQIAEAQGVARAWTEAGPASTGTPDDPTAALFAALDAVAIEDVRAALANVVDVNIRDGEGWTPLALAVAGGNPEIVAALLGVGANANLANADGITPLMVAAVQGDHSAAEALLAAGADPGATQADGLTASQMAELGGHTDLATLLAPTPELAIKAVDRTLYVQSNANLRNGPSKEAAVLTVIPAGTELSISGVTADGTWMRVALPDEQVAFIHTSLVAETPPAPREAEESVPAASAATTDPSTNPALPPLIAILESQCLMSDLEYRNAPYTVRIRVDLEKMVLLSEEDVIDNSGAPINKNTTRADLEAFYENDFHNPTLTGEVWFHEVKLDIIPKIMFKIIRQEVLHYVKYRAILYVIQDHNHMLSFSTCYVDSAASAQSDMRRFVDTLVGIVRIVTGRTIDVEAIN